MQSFKTISETDTDSDNNHIMQSHELIPPGQYGRHFTDDDFRCIFVNEKFCILIKFQPKFFPKGPIENNPALV